MRESRVLKKLRSGEVVSCFKLNFADQRSCEIAAMNGFDCLWSDMEHTANDYSVIERQVYTSKVYDVDLLVRVPRGGNSDYIRPLELDASGIMIPHLMGIEDAKEVVKRTRFHPLGRRALDGGNSDGRYCEMPLLEYMEQSNEQRFIVVQIEDYEPLEHLDEICSLKGIDMVFFGPCDFSHSIGKPAQFEDPLIKETRDNIAKYARKHGKYAGTTGRSGDVNELVDLGYTFISIGADVVGLNNYCKQVYSVFSNRKNTLDKK